MIDPKRDDAVAADGLSVAERHARVEQLLLAGLDEYFAGRLDQAINVWTRVLFLDRLNDRARAYIDRARRAQAERQRESDALVHEGLQAFDDGDVEGARRLLTMATERGASHEQTLPMLHRIGLLDVASGAPPSVAIAARWPVSATVAGPAAATRRWGPVLVVVVAVAAAAMVLARANADDEVGRAVSTWPATPSPLPVPTVSEAYLARAEALFRAGKLADALAVLNRVGASDGHFGQAQALRAEVQRALLGAAAGLAVSPPEVAR